MNAHTLLRLLANTNISCEWGEAGRSAQFIINVAAAISANVPLTGTMDVKHEESALKLAGCLDGLSAMIRKSVNTINPTSGGESA